MSLKLVYEFQFKDLRLGRGPDKFNGMHFDMNCIEAITHISEDFQSSEVGFTVVTNLGGNIYLSTWGSKNPHAQALDEEDPRFEVRAPEQKRRIREHFAASQELEIKMNTNYMYFALEHEKLVKAWKEHETRFLHERFG